MFFRLLLLFTIIPFVELAILYKIADQFGFLQTILLVLVTGILGAALARREGVRCWQKIQEKLVAGQAPGAELIEGPLILLAGVLLITPGVLTDLCGFALLVPPFRKAIARQMAARFRSQFTIHTPSGFKSWTSNTGSRVDPDSAPELTGEETPPGGSSGDKIIDVTFLDPEERSDR